MLLYFSRFFRRLKLKLYVKKIYTSQNREFSFTRLFFPVVAITIFYLRIFFFPPLQTEQRRAREWAGRLERERQLQLENYGIKLQAAELDSSSLRDEIARVREQLERARADKIRLENDLRDARREADAARESERHAISRANEAHHQLDAMREELSLRSEDQQRLEELVQQVVQLQARNKSMFIVVNDELL